MSVKYVVSLFAATLIVFANSPSYGAEIVSCNGFESCPTNDGDAIVALEARIEALEASRAYLYDAEDQKIGLYVGDSIPELLSAIPEGNIPLAQVITSDGYTMWINWKDGGLIAPERMIEVLTGGTLVAKEVFPTNDCSGLAYVGVYNPGNLFSIAFRGGTVVPLADGLLAKTGVTLSSFNALASKDGINGTCTSSGPQAVLAVPIEQFAIPSDFNLDAQMKFKIPLKIKMG